MPDVFMLEGLVGYVVLIALIVLKAFAFVNACLWPADAYAAADKLTKNSWLAILGIALLLQLPLLGGAFFQILNLAGIVAAIVYLVDVRPAMSALTRR
jgi:hypothetical protein